jgi:cytochrome oxidase Cu insertion factor (SCO1/SenC/PrrC family)
MLNHTDVVEERGTSNYGELIQPPRPIADLPLIDPLNDAADYKLHGKWNLVYVTDVCEQVCRDNLYRMRQIHVGTDKYSLRVQRVLFMKNQTAEQLKQDLEEYAGQRVVAPENKETFLTLFTLNKDDQPLMKNRLYIVDPMGNLMMSYAPDAPPNGILKDIKKLLKASRIG